MANSTQKKTQVCKQSKTAPISISHRISCYSLLLLYDTPSNSQLHSFIKPNLCLSNKQFCNVLQHLFWHFPDCKCSCSRHILPLYDYQCILTRLLFLIISLFIRTFYYNFIYINPTGVRRQKSKCSAVTLVNYLASDVSKKKKTKTTFSNDTKTYTWAQVLLVSSLSP